MLLMTAVHIHQTQDVHTEGNPLQMPSYVPSHRYGSLGLQENDINVVKHKTNH